MSHRAKINKGKLIKNKEKISIKNKGKLLVIHASMIGMNQRQLWDLYGVLCKSPNDEFKPLIFKMLDFEFTKRKIIHDFSDDYTKEK